eukprot:4700198-Alexandrium_andersonii.AAC.1
MWVFWHLLNEDAWQVGQARTRGERDEMSVQRLMLDLHAWYRGRRSGPGEITEVQQISMKMLGSREHPNLKVKAAECYGLCLFCIDELRRFPTLANSGRLQEAGAAMARHFAIMKEHDR